MRQIGGLAAGRIPVEINFTLRVRAAWQTWTSDGLTQPPSALPIVRPGLPPSVGGFDKHIIGTARLWPLTIRPGRQKRAWLVTDPILGNACWIHASMGGKAIGRVVRP
jgi:hypothetical protein